MPLTRIGVGSIVCAHPDGDRRDPWLGIVRAMRTGDTVVYRVSQRLGITEFDFHRWELCETLLTFEGPMCIACKRANVW